MPHRVGRAKAKISFMGLPVVRSLVIDTLLCDEKTCALIGYRIIIVIRPAPAKRLFSQFSARIWPQSPALQVYQEGDTHIGRTEGLDTDMFVFVGVALIDVGGIFR